MQNQPWASGPGEILRHGLSLLLEDSDTNRRLALLIIDNAVELTIKTFISLPRRVTGINLSRKDYLEICESFPRLMDAIEQYASDKLNGIDLAEIEWYHRLRNELYHQGNGLTVERNKVEVYAELAKVLFGNLFGIDIEVNLNETGRQELIGKFLAVWVQVERKAWAALERFRNNSDQRRRTNVFVFRELLDLKVIDSQTGQDIDALRILRNGVVHGDEESIKNLTAVHIKKANEILVKLSAIATASSNS